MIPEVQNVFFPLLVLVGLAEQARLQKHFVQTFVRHFVQDTNIQLYGFSIISDGAAFVGLWFA